MSNLDDLYREIILDHYRTPRNRGALDSPPAVRVEGFNPLCGDELVLYLAVDNGVVTDIKMTGHGCSISQASSSLMSVAVKGKSLEQVETVMERFKEMMTLKERGLDENGEAVPLDLRSLGEIAALAGVVKFPVRIKCATLAWKTLAEAVAEATSS
ncbi:MAG: Fe-S cluster assembly sulfur transfer protein SufU [Acidimicrobiales bacterium]